jgi:enoyl-CoA hydratase
MDYTQITYERVGRVARVSLNRPQYRNPVGRICIEELDHAFAAAVEDPDVGAIVLRGEGPHFSAGHDLGTPEKIKDDEERPFPPGGRGTFQRSWELYLEPGIRWRNLPIPTIAAVQGYCIWGGWMVVATIDIIFASDDAMFFPTKGQYCTVPWDVGIRKAKELLFEPRFMSAQEAREVGFVNRVLPGDQLDDQTMEYAARVAENDAFQLRMIKLAINQAQDAQGYTNHAFAPTGMNEGGSAQGKQLLSGHRRIAPIERALENQELAHGLRP